MTTLSVGRRRNGASRSSGKYSSKDSHNRSGRDGGRGSGKGSGNDISRVSSEIRIDLVAFPEFEPGKVMQRIVAALALEAKASITQVSAAVALFDEGATVPFIARYRKEATGGLDDTQLRLLDDRLRYRRDLEARRAAVIRSVLEQGKLTDTLKSELLLADTLARLEDLYLPYKQKRRTKAMIAREAGLEPLALLLLMEPQHDPQVEALRYVGAMPKEPEDAMPMPAAKVLLRTKVVAGKAVFASTGKSKTAFSKSVVVNPVIVKSRTATATMPEIVVPIPAVASISDTTSADSEHAGTAPVGAESTQTSTPATESTLIAATVTDASASRTNALEATAFEATAFEATEVEPTEVEPTEVEATEVEATVNNATATEAALVETKPIDTDTAETVPTAASAVDTSAADMNAVESSAESQADVQVAKPAEPVSPFADVKAVLNGARDILVERFSEDANLVASLRDMLRTKGFVLSQLIEGKADAGAKFSDYFKHTERFATIPSHRALAMFRGRGETVLRLELSIDEVSPENPQRTPFNACEERIAAYNQIADQNRPADSWLLEVVRWSWRTRLAMQLQIDLFGTLREQAETEAIRVFGANLKDLLLAAPAGHKATMGLDPGIRTGVKCAVVDATGKVLATDTVFPHQPRNDLDGSIATLAALCVSHHVSLIAIGNGTASRETEQMTREMLKRHPELSLTPVVVSEAGASVYSASALAAKEFPGLDVSLRGAVSIARRLQDPLAELVKIDPKSIGVGQYQHDVNPSQLGRALDAVVEDCVNAVGVDLNTASAPLLARVSGLNSAVAQSIVQYRDGNGAFASRESLKKVPRLGERSFEQCAGFLRIMNGENPLDASAVHPEAYPVVQKMLERIQSDAAAVIGNRDLLSQLNPSDYVDERFGLPTINDILKELEKPGRDPRPEFRTARFAEGVSDLNDLKPGMVLEGVVTNVTAFGAFIDIGVHQDGLAHVSELADRFVKDPRDAIKTGQIVKARVLEVDIKRKRIALTLKSQPGSQQSPGRAHQGQPREPRAVHERHSRAGPQGRVAHVPHSTAVDPSASGVIQNVDGAETSAWPLTADARRFAPRDRADHDLRRGPEPKQGDGRHDGQDRNKDRSQRGDQSGRHQGGGQRSGQGSGRSSGQGSGQSSGQGNSNQGTGQGSSNQRTGSSNQRAGQGGSSQRTGQGSSSGQGASSQRSSGGFVNNALADALARAREAAKGR